MAPRIQPPSASDDLYPEPSPSNTSLPWPEMPLQGQAARPQGQEHGDPHNENCGLCALRDFKRRFEPQSGAKPDGVDKRAVPLVFVTGFSGWNAALFDTFNYWGGFQNLPQLLADEGYAVIVVRIGPLSSNWERACEVYAQLMAAQLMVESETNPGTDDSPAHGFDTAGSTTDHITIDYGNLYPGRFTESFDDRLSPNRARAVLFGTLPPAWKWSAKNPVHFICHSQGGTTIRYLVSLMTSNFDNLHDQYFATPGRGNWTKSVTTIGTPHRGTTIIDVLKLHAPPAWRALLARLVTSASFIPAMTPTPGHTRFYDLSLDHRGISAKPGESYADMYDRVSAPGGPLHCWLASRMNGFWDNSIEGVASLTGFTSRHPSVGTYYFTMSFAATTPPPSITLTADEIAGFPNPIYRVVHRLPFIDQTTAFITNRVLDWVADPRELVVWVTGIANRVLENTQGGPFPISLPAPGSQIPRGDMLPLLMATGYGMGGYALTAEQAGMLEVDTNESVRDAWQVNDGVVNTESMAGPVGAMIVPVLEFDPTRVGTEVVWWTFGVNTTLDHADEIGAFTDGSMSHDIAGMYSDIAFVVSHLQ